MLRADSLKRPWCWERLRAGGEGEDRGWDGWMASPTQWTWAWVNSGSWWWTGRPGVLQFMGSQRVGHDWATELNWTVAVWDSPRPVTSGRWAPVTRSVGQRQNETVLRRRNVVYGCSLFFHFYFIIKTKSAMALISGLCRIKYRPTLIIHQLFSASYICMKTYMCVYIWEGVNGPSTHFHIQHIL